MKKILLVEDDEVVSTIYRSRLAALGFEVQVADDGEKGIKLAQEFAPDVMVLDLGLPKLDGLEVLKCLRTGPLTSHLPIIVLTNAYLANRVKDAWTAGATRCVTKSECTPKVLVEIIGRIHEPSHASAPLKPLVPPPKPAPEIKPTIAFAAGAELFKELNSKQAFLEQAPASVAQLRQKVQEMLRCQRPETAIFFIAELHAQVRSLGAKAGLAGLSRIARMASALEALLEEMRQRPDLLTASSQRTVIQAIDFLDELQRKSGGGESDLPVEGVLVVDDEPLSRRAVTVALERVGLKCVDLDDPQAALAMATGMEFDLIILDIEMPGMNGFELCKQIRALPHYKNTAVVFVSSLTDFQSRAQSTLSGGNDLIAKPFHFLELGVKSLIHLWRPQLNRVS
jgi:DNA-binding response OmpR family regulator